MRIAGSDEVLIESVDRMIVRGVRFASGRNGCAGGLNA